MPTLHWLTRDADLTAAGKAPYRLLDPVPELSHGDPSAENMLIQGDNLDALKALRAGACGTGPRTTIIVLSSHIGQLVSRQ